MRALLLAMSLLLPLPILAAQDVPPGEAAHGQETAHAGEAHHQRTYFGIPGWILKLVNMVLFFGFLAWLVVGPIKNILRERRERIRQQLAEARERDARADRMAEEIRERLRKLEDEVAMILRRAEQEGERQKQQLMAAANDDAEKILRSARSEVEARVKLARKELTEYAGELAAQRAHRLLEQSLNEADRRKLFEESLAALPEERS